MNNKVFNVLDSPSFLKGYKEIYIDGIYDFKQSSINSSSPFIIDCGSNIGLSIAYFKSIYPGSKIIGVEADKHIFEILSENVNHYRYVSLINGAISSYKGQLAFLSNGSDGGRIIQNKDEKSFLVQSVDLDTLIQPETDLLKIDIEGAETDVILNSTKLNMVNQIFIEYHSFSAEGQSLHLILEKLYSCGFRYYIQTQFCPPQPFKELSDLNGMDLQLNIFAINMKTL